MASTQRENQTADTFTKMSVADVEAIGAHCQMAFCHQLDFLPFRCDSCQGCVCQPDESQPHTVTDILITANFALTIERKPHTHVHTRASGQDGAHSNKHRRISRR